MNAPHPADDLLRQYSVGQMSDESAGELERHLAECPQCEETLDNLAVGDETLISELRRPAVVDPVLEEPELQVALAQIVEHAAGVSEAAGESSHEAEGREIGVYRLLEELGSGGMGTVYKALHTRLEKEVALKILATERLKDPHAVSRFDREMKAVGKLEHPHIVRAYDAGELEGQHFLVTEYVKGCDLSQLSRKLGPLPIADACELARQAALGLEEAHEHGMVHRDIKPANLFLARQKGRPPMVKVLDLGLALIAGEHAPTDELTGTGQIMGTIDYMAPEQAGDTHNVDIRADVYSLGATLYRLLTGSSIYRTDKQQSVMQKLTALATQPAPPIQSRRADVPDELAAVVHRMLEKDPAGRYATPADVVQALEPFCAGHDLKALLKPGDVERTIADDEAAENSASMHDGSVETQDAVDPGLQPTLISTADHVAGAETVVRPRSTGRGWTRWVLGAAAVAAVLLGVILIQTKEGTIRIETNQTDVEVLIDDEKTVYITDPNDKTKIIVKIPQGAQTLRVRKAGFVADTEKFELETVKGLVKVMFVPGKERAVGGDVDRDVAEWVLSIGGKIAIDVQGKKTKFLSSQEQLPAAQFRLYAVDLDYNKRVTDNDLTRLSRLSNLKSIRLQYTAITSRGLAHLSSLKSLTTLGLAATNVTDDGMPFLESLSELSYLHLAHTQVSNEGLTSVGKLTTITHLVLSGSRCTDVGLARLNRLNEIESLYIGGPGTTDDCVDYLKAFPKLNLLGISVANLTDAGLKQLARDCPRLHSLTMSDIQITDEGVKYLAALKHLSGSLGISNSALTDKAIPSLKGCVRVHVMDLKGTKLSSSGILELQKALPKCRIEWDGGVIEPNAPQAKPWHPTEEQREFIDRVAKLPAGEQAATVIERLKLVNSFKYKAVWKHEIENGRVTRMQHIWDHLGPFDAHVSYWPLAALRHLTSLDVPITLATDLGPLRTLPLERMNRVGISPFHPRAKDFVESFSQLKSINGSATPAAWLARKQEIEELRKLIPTYAPKKQIELVANKLMEFNPGFDGVLKSDQYEDGRVRLLIVHGREIVDLSPLSCIPLTSLWCRDTSTADLSPLKGMQLTELNLQYDPVTDLSPLSGMPLKNLNINGCYGVSDLSPLQGLPLQRFECSGTRVTDLSPLESMRLTSLYMPNMHVSDLSPLKGMPLEFLDCSGIDGPKLPHLTGMPLRLLRVKRMNKAGVAALHKALPTCRIEWDGGVIEPNVPPSKLWEPTVEQKAFLDRVAKLPAVGQVAAVRAKLREVNPGFDGAVTHKIEAGAVTEFEFLTDEVTEIWPVRAFPKLARLSCAGTARGRGQLASLAELAGLRLTELNCEENRVADLSPLIGMPLTRLTMPGTQVSDLRPLKEMPLTHVNICYAPVSDLSPLAGMPLGYLNCGYTNVSDLSPVTGMPLGYLSCFATRVPDLGPLTGSPVNSLVVGMRLFDASHEKQLRSFPLQQMYLFSGDGSVVRPTEYWKQVEARREAAYAFASETARLPVEKQVDAVFKKLIELNTFKGQSRVGAMRHVLANGTVSEVTLVLQNAEGVRGRDWYRTASRDITPLMAFKQLRKLTLTGGPHFLDISAVRHLPLEELNCTDDIAFKNSGVLKEMTTLNRINGKAAAEYWKALPERMKAGAK